MLYTVNLDLCYCVGLLQIQSHIRTNFQGMQFLQIDDEFQDFHGFIFVDYSFFTQASIGLVLRNVNVFEDEKFADSKQL